MRNLSLKIRDLVYLISCVYQI